MRFALAALLVAHGLIHLMGFAKAFRLAELPQLTVPIPPVAGVMWLVAAVLFVGAALALFVWPRGWWIVGAAATALSLVLVARSWTDAKVGALADGVVLAAVAIGFLSQGPFSARAQYERDVAANLTRTPSARLVTDADLVHLPGLVQRFLKRSGVVGHPEVTSVRARMHGRIRSGPEAGWMTFTAEQHNFFDRPARLFSMDASMYLMPVQVSHRYVGGHASMKARVVGLVPVMDMSGADATRTETVTMLNDMCLLAPASLIRAPIDWQAVDAHTVRAAFTNAGHTVRADLVFDEAGDLTNFISDDRGQSSTDGKMLNTQTIRWSTPVGAFGTFGPFRLMRKGEARWHDPRGEYAYIEIELDDIQFNVRGR